MSLRSSSFVVFLFVLAAPVQAQAIDTTVVAENPPTTRDIRLLHAIYGIDNPAFTATMRGANWSSYKVFVAAPPALWFGAIVLDDEHDYKPAYLLTLTEIGTVGLVFAMKNVVQRPRPYASLDSIESRVRRLKTEQVFDPYSFPSGHAAVSFAIATSLSLSYPEWYVVAPSMLWATTIALSRSWLGVHYPTDTAMGAMLGVGIALGVHALGEAIIPDGLLPDETDAALRRPAPPAVRFVIPL